MRVLVTGMGGELGTRVAQLLEERSEVKRDRRRRLRAAAPPAAPQRVPPHRPARPRQARRVRRRASRRRRSRTSASTSRRRGCARASAAERTSCARSPRSAPRRAPASSNGSSLRSGLEVYGRGRGRPGVPDETCTLAPHHAVRPLAARGRGDRRWISDAVTAFPVARVAHRARSRLARPVPLGRLLRLPVVPVPAFADPPFQLLHPDDAARAMVAALLLGVDGPFNVVGPGAATRGRRCASAGGSRCRCSAGLAVATRAVGARRRGDRRRTSSSSSRKGRTGGRVARRSRCSSSARCARPRRSAPSSSSGPKVTPLRPTSRWPRPSERRPERECRRERERSSSERHCAARLRRGPAQDPEHRSGDGDPPADRGSVPGRPVRRDPQLQDLIAPFVTATIRVQRRAPRAPSRVRSRGPRRRTAASGSSSPRSLAVAVRQEVGSPPPGRRRARRPDRRRPDAQARRGDVAIPATSRRCCAPSHLAAIPLGADLVPHRRRHAADPAPGRGDWATRSSRWRYARAVRSACRCGPGGWPSASRSRSAADPSARATRSPPRSSPKPPATAVQRLLDTF